jgi:Activator of Hsp90 ATPase homolog 1-like protein
MDTNTSRSTFDSDLPRLNGLRTRRFETNWDIQMRVGIRADHRRIVDAMTLPEYVEAWMRPTNSDPHTSVAALRIADRFRIDFYRFGALDSSITGSFRIYMHDKLTFTWRRFGPVEDAASIVNVVLQTDNGESLLELHHTGLPSIEEKVWHQRFWQASLSNLALIFS